MLSTEYTKKFFNDPTISEEEAKELRDIFDTRADILLERLAQEKRKNNE